MLLYTVFYKNAETKPMIDLIQYKLITLKIVEKENKMVLFSTSEAFQKLSEEQALLFIENYSLITAIFMTVHRICPNIIQGTKASEILPDFLKMVNSSKKTFQFKEELRKYLKSNKSIHLEGFILFRGKELIKEIEHYISLVFNEYYVQKRFSEFIELIQYYINSEACREQTLHIYYTNSYIRIMDTNHKDITKKVVQSHLSQHDSIEGNTNDFIISALLEYVPQSIVIHGLNYARIPKIVETIMLIFKKRVTLCNHCIFCKTSGLLSQSE